MKKLILISIILMSFMSFAETSFDNDSDAESDLCTEVNQTTLEEGGSDEPIDTKGDKGVNN